MNKKLRIACIGSRETPKHILEEMQKIAIEIVNSGHMILSGGADGADNAFQTGAINAIMNMDIPLKEWNEMVKKHLAVIIPWDNFNMLSRSKFDWVYNFDDMKTDLQDEAFQIMEKYHPSFKQLVGGAKKLMARNGFQVLGHDLKHPVDLVVCWTKNGKPMGGTGQAMRIAKDYNIPIVNLKNEPFNYAYLNEVQVY